MTVESTEVTTGAETAATETPAAETAAPAAESGSPTAQAAQVAQVYNPNFEFKYRGVDKSDASGQFDDIYKPLIKDAATEKKIRELHEKAYGLDFVKSDRDRMKGEFEPQIQAYQNQSQALAQLSAYVRNDDLGSFFDTLKIPKEQVLRYALQQVQLDQMDPQARAQFERQQADKRQFSDLQLENARLSQGFEQVAVQQRTMELDSTLSRPEVLATIESFDQRAGRPGAFRSMVIQRGQWYALSQGLDMPAAQIVQEVLSLVGNQVTAAGQQSGGAAASAPKPVLPRIDGKGTSPAKRVLKSTDDLRKLSEQLAAAGQ